LSHGVLFGALVEGTYGSRSSWSFQRYVFSGSRGGGHRWNADMLDLGILGSLAYGEVQRDGFGHVQRMYDTKYESQFDTGRQPFSHTF